MSTKIIRLILFVICLPAVFSETPVITDVSQSTNNIVAGVNFTLKCRANNSVTTWFRNDVVVEFSKEKLLEKVGQDLKIVEPRVGVSEGKFGCKVTNKEGKSAKLSYAINVKVKFFNEKFEITPKDTFFYNIENHTLAFGNCGPPKAIPPAKVIWVKNDTGLPIKIDNTRVKSVLIGLFWQLIIDPSKPADAGIYGCKAEHELGTAFSWFNVKFYGPPPTPKNVRLKQLQFKSFAIEWDHVRNDLDHYRINVTSKKDFKMRSYTMKEYSIPLLRQFTSFVVPDVDTDVDYSVQIRAIDSVGQKSGWSDKLKVKTLSQIGPVLITDLAKRINVAELTSPVLTCDIQGNPEPAFKWFRNSVEIGANNPDFKTSGNNLTLVNVKRANGTQHAKFKCEGSNKLGKQESREATLIVQWINGEFESAPISRIYYPNTQILRVPLIPPKAFMDATLKWSQTGAVINQITHSRYVFSRFKGLDGNVQNAMDINNPKGQAAGRYVVEAFNKGGSVKAVFHLIMAAAPRPISHFKIIKVVHGVVTVEWNPPASIRRIADLGGVYKYRRDIKECTIEVSGGDKTWQVKTKGEYKDEKYFTKTYQIKNLKAGPKYTFKIKCTDEGDQASGWSSTISQTIARDLPPEIPFGPDPMYTPFEGREFLLPCKSSATPAATIKWFKNKVEVKSSDPLYKIDDVGSLVFVKSKRAKHDGLYQCTARNKYGKVKSEVSNVTVAYFDDDYEHTRLHAGFYDKEKFRDTAVLCLPPPSYPPARVLWTTGPKNLKFINFAEDPNIKRVDNFVKKGRKYYALTIKDAKIYKDRVFGCSSYNPLLGFDDEYKIAYTTIMKFSKPEVSDMKYRMISPTKVNVSWVNSFDDVENALSVFNNGGTKLKTIDVDRNVHVETVEQSNRFKFTLIATGPDADTSNPTTVIMKDASPTLTQDLKEDGPTPRAGWSNTTLHCDYEGVPYPTITWQRNGKNITKEDTDFKLESYNRYLTLQDTSHLKHTGKYQCIGDNGIQSDVASKKSFVRVIYINSTLQYAGKDQAFYDHDSDRGARLSCQAPLAFPEITNVTWGRGSTELTGSKYTFSKHRGRDVIEFLAHKSDVGEYWCHYENVAGDVRHNIQLKIHDGPPRPRALELVTLSWNFFIVKWVEPVEDVDGYLLTYFKHPNQLNRVNLESDVIEQRVNDLKENTTYTVELFAVKGRKKSLPATIEIDTIEKSEIGIPTAVRDLEIANIDGKGADVHWEVPKNLNGSHPLQISYQVTRCNLKCEDLDPTKELKLRLTDLQSETKYTVYVAPINELNVHGPKTKTTFTTLKASALSSILNFKSKSKGWDRVELTWDSLPSEDLAKFKRFSLTAQAASERVTESVPTKSTSYVVDGLSEGRTYTFTMYGVGKGNDDGPEAVVKVATVDLGLLGAVDLPRVVLKSGYEKNFASVVWRYPTQLSNSHIEEISYSVRVCLRNDCNKTAIAKNKLSLPLHNLLSDTEYEVTVTSLRPDLEKGKSASFKFRTLKKNRTPTQPEAVRILKDAENIHVLWEAPHFLAGTDPDEMKFKITVCEQRSTTNCYKATTVGRKHVISGRKPLTKYRVTIAALSFRNQPGTQYSIEVTTAEEGSPTLQPPAKPPIKHKPDNDDDGLSGGSVAGIVIAVLLIVIIAGVSAAVFWRYKRRGEFKGGEQELRNYNTEK